MQADWNFVALIGLHPPVTRRLQQARKGSFETRRHVNLSQEKQPTCQGDPIWRTYRRAGGHHASLAPSALWIVPPPSRQPKDASLKPQPPSLHRPRTSFPHSLALSAMLLEPPFRQAGPNAFRFCRRATLKKTVHVDQLGIHASPVQPVTEFLYAFPHFQETDFHRHPVLRIRPPGPVSKNAQKK